MIIKILAVIGLVAVARWLLDAIAGHYARRAAPAKRAQLRRRAGVYNRRRAR
jgi:hypothetical protein